MNELSVLNGKLTAESLQTLANQAKSHLGAPTAASFTFFRELIDKISADSDLATAELKVECLLDATQFFYVAGHPFYGIAATQQAVPLAESSGNKSLLRKTLNFLGIMCADTGNIPSAIESYARSLELAQELRDEIAEYSTWNNLGLALMYAAQYREAIECFLKAIRLSENHPELAFDRVAALTNASLAYLHLEEFQLGLRAIEQATQSSAEPSSINEFLSGTIRENHYSRLLLEVNNLQKAKERCDIAKRYAGQARTARAEIVASVAEGLYEVHAGLLDVGLSRLTATLEKARLIRSSLRDCLIAMIKAYEIAGQPERALTYLRELLDHTHKQQQDNALRHLELHLDQLPSEVPKLATADPLERREALLRSKVAEQELFRSRLEMLERLAVAAELRDDSTGEHSYRVGKMASLLAIEYGCDDDTNFMLDLAGRLHDIGKIGVPDAVLLKPARLNEAEILIMRAHTTVGAELLAKSNMPHMQMAEEIARYHHEWWDGSGYPNNLSGSAIPIAARITALADVFDALTHERPYKPAWTITDAMDEIKSLRGRQFDPDLTDLFLDLVPRLQKEHGDLDAFLGQEARKSPFLQARSKIWNSLSQSDPDQPQL